MNAPGKAQVPAADLTVTIGRAEGDPTRLPADMPTRIGRGTAVGGLPDERWVPRQLLDILPDREAWRVLVRRGPAEIAGDLMSGTVAEGAQLVFGTGSHDLVWDLKERISITIQIAVPRVDEMRDPRMRPPSPFATTARERWHHHVRPEERRPLAIAYSHLLEQRPRHRDHWARAAAAISEETSADQFRRWVRKRKERLERDLLREGREQVFSDLDDYGLWLIRHRQISRDDLP